MRSNSLVETIYTYTRDIAKLDSRRAEEKLLAAEQTLTTINNKKEKVGELLATKCDPQFSPLFKLLDALVSLECYLTKTPLALKKLSNGLELVNKHKETVENFLKEAFRPMNRVDKLDAIRWLNEVLLDKANSPAGELAQNLMISDKEAIAIKGRIVKTLGLDQGEVPDDVIILESDDNTRLDAKIKFEDFYDEPPSDDQVLEDTVDNFTFMLKEPFKDNVSQQAHDILQKSQEDFQEINYNSLNPIYRDIEVPGSPSILDLVITSSSISKKDFSILLNKASNETIADALIYASMPKNVSPRMDLIKLAAQKLGKKGVNQEVNYKPVGSFYEDKKWIIDISGEDSIREDISPLEAAKKYNPAIFKSLNSLF